VPSLVTKRKRVQ